MNLSITTLSWKPTKLLVEYWMLCYWTKDVTMYLKHQLLVKHGHWDDWVTYFKSVSYYNEMGKKEGVKHEWGVGVGQINPIFKQYENDVSTLIYFVERIWQMPFCCGQVWTWRPNLVSNGHLWCVPSTWPTTTWPSCYSTEGPQPILAKVAACSIISLFYEVHMELLR